MWKTHSLCKRGEKGCSTSDITSTSLSISSNLSSFDWYFIGLPYEECKQVFGDVLPIIGFEVDLNLMRVLMSDESKLQLIIAVQDFALMAQGIC